MDLSKQRTWFTSVRFLVLCNLDDGGITSVFAESIEYVVGQGEGLNYERFLKFALAAYHLDTEAGKRVSM